MKKLKTIELKRISLEEFKLIDKSPVNVVLDDIRSAHNVGSIFRICDAFLIKKLFLCGITPCPPSKEIRKTALGASDSVNWEYQTDACELVKKLKKEGDTIVSIEQTDKSINLDQIETSNNNLTIVFGNEINGVCEKILKNSDQIIEIPQFGTKHSLNVSVATGIVLWEINKKLRVKK